ncbi:hypothetical protein ACKF11_12785 [Methylobacillus sp. Pita2]|uniref:hypothetical protein n=1 Tax=Methylobacillus sp. Pita2 TaxID=3383245 RepID=UPI0038B61B98
MNNQTQPIEVDINTAYQMMVAASPDDAALEELLAKLMGMTVYDELSDVHREHYRQAAAAASTLIAIQEAGNVPAFNPFDFVCGLPAMAFRLVFARRIADLRGVDVGLNE